MLVSFVLVLALASFGVWPVKAEDYSSSSFIVRDPVINIAATQASSSSFQFYSSAGQLAPGESSSANFSYKAGFLYFATATTPVISATAGNGQVSFTWTASTGTFGNVTNYQLGTATSSGGSFTYESVGNVVSYTKTGLTNGTTYYFKVKAEAGGRTVAESAEVSSTPVAPADTGGGG